MRQSQGSVVCASCGKLVGINEQSCPFCGAWRPGLFGWAPVLQRVVGLHLDLVSLIVTTCITLYAVSLLLQPEAIFASQGLMGILSPGTRALFQLGMTGGAAWQFGWWWTLLTANYLHGSLLHVVFSVMWIRSLGQPVTEIYGPARTFVLFNAAGVFGFLVSNVMSGAPTIGASCGIFGLMAAQIVYGRKRGSSVMTARLYQLAFIMFIFGFLMPNINNWGHAGGFVGGWMAAHLMGFIDEQRESTSMMITALALIVMTAGGVVLSFVNVTGLLLGS